MVGKGYFSSTNTLLEKASPAALSLETIQLKELDAH